MRRKSATLAAALLCAVALLTACSDETPGVIDTGGGGMTPSSQPNGSATGLPHSGAPKVANPIADTSSFEADPCSALKPEQLQSIGLKSSNPQREDSNEGSPGCVWEFDRDTASALNVVLITAGDRQGLSTVYARKANGTVTLFEEQPPVEGFPAVVAMAEDVRGDGKCLLGVGLRDDLLFEVGMSADPELEQGKDPCGWAQKVAELAVQTMKGAS